MSGHRWVASQAPGGGPRSRCFWCGLLWYPHEPMPAERECVWAPASLVLQHFKTDQTLVAYWWDVGPYRWRLDKVSGQPYAYELYDMDGVALSAGHDSPTELEAHAVRVTRDYANAMLNACGASESPGLSSAARMAADREALRTGPQREPVQDPLPAWRKEQAERALVSLRAWATIRVQHGEPIAWVSDTHVYRRAALYPSKGPGWWLVRSDHREYSLPIEGVITELEHAIAIVAVEP